MHTTTPARPLLVTDNDYAFISGIIEQNKSLVAATRTSGWKELRNFGRFTSTMIWAFPTSRIMRWKIRRNQQLKQLLQFEELIPVRNNIEKGSFAYDTLLFKEGFFSLIKNKSHLANLVCLAILFGDEFIDGVALEFGKKETARLLHDPAYNFNLGVRQNNQQQFELYYAFDICSLLPAKVLNSINRKYEIRYADFYKHLLFLLSEMNKQLAALPASIAEEASRLICKVCNLCFTTYKEDITGFNEHYNFNDLMLYQKSKDDDIIMLLLSLRAVLLKKKKLHYQKQFPSWSSMVRCMQLYDDMEDAAGDCDFQMNMCCWLAKNYFIQECQWLQQHKETLKQQKGTALRVQIALNMPGSCMLMMQYARNICMSRLDWVQQKIINYLWRKNWLGFTKEKTNQQEAFISPLIPGNSPSPAMQLHFIRQKTAAAQHPLLTEEMKNAWSMDIALMDPQLRKYVLSKISLKEKYALLNHFLEWDMAKKSALFTKITKG